MYSQANNCMVERVSHTPKKQCVHPHWFETLLSRNCWVNTGVGHPPDVGADLPDRLKEKRLAHILRGVPNLPRIWHC